MTQFIDALFVLSDSTRRSEVQSDLGRMWIEIVSEPQAVLETLERSEIPYFIVMDLDMDPLLELCSTLKKHPLYSVIPIYVLGQKLSAELIENYGIEELVKYPLTPEKFNFLKSHCKHVPKQYEEVLQLEHARQVPPTDEIHDLRDNDFRKFKRYMQAQLCLNQEIVNDIQAYRNHQLYDLGLKLKLTNLKLSEYVAQFFNLQIILHLEDYTYETGVVSEQFSRKNYVLPLRDKHNAPYLAIANPFLLEVVDLAERYFKNYTPVICCPELIEEALNPEFKKSERYQVWNSVRKWRIRQLQHRSLPPAPQDSFASPASSLRANKIPEVPTIHTEAHPTVAEFVASLDDLPEKQARQEEGLFINPEAALAQSADEEPGLNSEAEQSFAPPEPISMGELDDDGLEPIENEPPDPKDIRVEFKKAQEAHALESRLARAHEAFKQRSYIQEQMALQEQLQVSVPEGADPDTAPIIHLVNSLIAKAHLVGASDIHIEPQENDVLVRFRIDGQLQVIHQFEPRAMIRPIAARIKIMCDLDITERRLPQDGSIHFANFNPDHDIEIRVATAPMKYGEKVVMRLLDRHQNILPLKEVGFSQHAYTIYQQKIKSPYGMILHVGPTGSGKSTTLYAALNYISNTTLNVQTIEDPVEYTLPGVNQLEINSEIGLSFARALRSYLRQDPDVILVGEIRDQETAKIAVQASLTGHLLLSTLHTNDATSTIIRLMEMGIPSYMIASSLLLVCGQRLLRRLCPACKQEQVATSEWAKILQLNPEKKHHLYHPVGCSECHQTGYRGRLAIYEVLTFDEHLRTLIQQPNMSSEVLRSEAIKAGLVTLFKDAVEKALLGLTSPDEVIKTVIPDAEPEV